MYRLAIAAAALFPQLALAGSPDYPGLVWVEKDADGPGVGLIHLAHRDGTSRSSFSATNPVAVMLGPHPIPEAHTLYWSELTGATARIRQAGLPVLGGTVNNPQTLIAGAAALAMDIHPSTWDIYWCDATTNKIHRVNNDGTSAVELITVGGVSCYGLALDAAGGKLYWTEFLTGLVKRANLNGTSIQTVFTAPDDYPYAIAIDHENAKLYWGACFGPIRRANLDGSNVEMVIAQPAGDGDCISGLAVDSDEGRIYWTLEGQGTLNTASLGGYAHEVIDDGMITSRQVALVHGFGVELNPLKIPAASAWALAVLTLALAILGTQVLRARSGTRGPVLCCNSRQKCHVKT